MNDLRHALRQLFQSPGYTLVMIVTLALGIGLNTSMFSLMNLLVLRPLPFPDKNHVVRIYRTTPQNPNDNHSAPSFLDLQREAAGFIKLAAYRQWGYTLIQPGRSAENLDGLRVSGDFFGILGLQPKLGRVFTAAEDHSGSQVAVLSHAAWLARFGGDPAVIGRSVSINNEAITIIGVMPEEFSSIFLWGPGDIFRPLALTATEKASSGDTPLQILGRFDSAVPLEQLNPRLATVATNLAPTRPREQSEDGLRAVLLQSSTMPPGTSAGMALILGLAGVVLLIICANLASLQLARAVSRSREFAIRAALGASRSRLLKPLLLESVALAVAGGLLGILVTVWGNEWIGKSMSAALPINFKMEIDWRVLTFAIVISLLTGVLFGLAPAWLAARVNMNDVLKSGGRGPSGDRSHHRFRNVLIVLQFAAVLVQLSCTGFFIRGMKQLQQRDIGWTTAGITQCVLNLPSTRYSTPEQSYAFYTSLQEKLLAVPGVDRVAIGWTAPLYQFLVTRNVLVAGREPPQPGREPSAFFNAITPGYVDTLRIRLVSGREFTAADGASAPPVVMINESLARALFPGQDPLGQRIKGNGGEEHTAAEIVGVFADVGLAGNPSPVSTPYQVFKPLAQETWTYVTVMVRSNNAGMTEPLRQAVNGLDPNIPVQLLNTMDEMARIATRGIELISTIFTGFSVLSLFLAALGLYGVIARLVSQRTGEIGVRIALGAQVRDILSLIMGAGFRLALIGAGLGLLGSVGMNLLMNAMFNTKGELNYLIILTTTALLVLVALVACWLPARRAARIDPLTALRTE